MRRNGYGLHAADLGNQRPLRDDAQKGGSRREGSATGRGSRRNFASRSFAVQVPALSVVPETTDVLCFEVLLCPGQCYEAVMVGYRCEAESLEGFVQQLAVAYLTHGYWFHVTGVVPADKDPCNVDRKLLDIYNVELSRWARTRRKRAGLANMQYLRYDRFFVLMATHGKHLFFEREVGQIRDARRVPIRIGGYSVSFRGGHAHVRIEQGEYKRLKARLLRAANDTRPEIVVEHFGQIRYVPYAPVRRQLLNVLRAVNRVRQERGFKRIDSDVLVLRRRVLRPFGTGAEGATPGARLPKAQEERAGVASREAPTGR